MGIPMVRGASSMLYARIVAQQANQARATGAYAQGGMKAQQSTAGAAQPKVPGLGDKLDVKG